MATVTTDERITERAEAADAFARDGYYRARGLFTPEEVAELRDAFMAQAQDGPVEGLSDGHWRHCDPSDPLAFYPRMMHPHRHPELPVGPLAMRRMLDPRLRTLLAALMGEEAVAAQSMFYFKPPGARGQDLHQDNFYLRVSPGTCCAMWLAIDDADAENGGLVVVPGSHRLEILCPTDADPSISFTGHHVDVPDGYAAVPADLKAGDVLFFNGSVIHGSTPNASADRFRRAFICHYVPRASAEVSHWYACVGFDGVPVGFDDATGGGPCGVPVESVQGPH